MLIFRTHSRALPALATCVVAVTTGAWAQQVDPVAEEMERWRMAHKHHLARLLEIRFEQEKNREPGSEISDDLLTHNASDALELLAPYEADASASVRRLAYGLVHRTGVLSRVSDVREEAVFRLVKGCSDPEGGVWQWAAKCLLSFEEPDFSPQARDVLRTIVVKEPIRDGVVRVVGVAGMTEMLGWLEKLPGDSSLALVVRARLGDGDAARAAVERVKAKYAENPALPKDHYFDDLAFTRNVTALEYIAPFLDSNEGDRTLEEAGNGDAVPYRQTALDVLAKHFRDCPVRKRLVPKYTEPELTQAREWIRRRLAEARQD